MTHIAQYKVVYREIPESACLKFSLKYSKCVDVYYKIIQNNDHNRLQRST